MNLEELLPFVRLDAFKIYEGNSLFKNNNCWDQDDVQQAILEHFLKYRSLLPSPDEDPIEDYKQWRVNGLKWMVTEETQKKDFSTISGYGYQSGVEMVSLDDDGDDRDEDGGMDDVIQYQVVHHDPTPEVATDEDDRQWAYHIANRVLTDFNFKIFHLSMMNHTQAEIAEMLGISRQAVNTRMVGIIASVRKGMEL